MSTPRSTEGLRRHTTQLRASTARKIKQAIREMKKKGLPINPNSVSRYSGVSRKTIYNHTDLLTQIRAAANKPVIRP
ncbi:transposase, partial [Mycobacteroides abscessus subsp. abscessus]